MSVKLVKADLDDLDTILQMQKEAFAALYEKYQDTETSPAAEKYEKLLFRYRQAETTYYFITVNNEKVGAMRVVDNQDGDSQKRISPIFIMQEYRRKGYAQQAIMEAERIHGKNRWKLDTILQEKGNCCLYEKLGYRQTGKTEKINDKMTIVFYEKE